MSIDLNYIRGFRNDQTDAEIIGAAKQLGDEWFIDHHDTYAWYRAIGVAKQPKRILELGVRYGYALIAMTRGAMNDDLNAMPVLTGIDSEFDGIESNAIAHRNIIHYVCYGHGAGCPHKILKLDTQTMNPLELADRAPFDIIHVDGNHSPAGIQKEIYIANALIDKSGWILVDDVDTPHVEKAALEFCAKNNIKPVFIPTFHGMLLLPMEDIVSN